MGFDLTNERIQDTYEQLLQISGSTIVDGTGSVAPVSLTSASYADFAVTASYAENAGDIDTSSLTPLSTFNAYTSSNDATFNAYTSSNDTEIADINTKIDAIEAGSGSADWLLLTNKPAGIVSSSAQTIQNLSGSVYVRDDENVVLSNPNGNQTFTIEDPSGNPGIIFRGAPDYITTFENAVLDMGLADIINISELTGSWGSIRNVGSNRIRLQAGRGDGGLQLGNQNGYTVELFKDTGVNDGYADFFVPVTASYGLQASDALISGDLTVNGTASFGYLQSITGSAKIVGDAFIQVNTDTPALRYAGLQIVDSGSTADTASFIWDSQNNDFFYEYEGDDTDYGVFLIGPEYGTKGSPTYNASNKLVKGTGGHHLVDSSITDTGTSVSMSAPLTASAFSGDGSGLSGLPLSLGNGSGGSNSIITQNVTSNDAVAQANGAIAIGDSALVNQSVSTDAITLGRDSAAYGIRAISIGYGAGSILQQADYSIAIGSAAETTDPACIAIGKNAEATAENGLAIGIDASSTGFSGVSIGELSSTTSDDTVAIGTRAEATNNYAIAMGRSAEAGGSKAIAIGFDATANGSFSVALGDEANAGGSNSFAQAAAASAAGDHSIAFGELASAGQDHSIVMGQGAASTATNGIAIGSGSSVSSANEINIAGIFKYDGSSDVTLEGSVTSSGNHQVDGQLYSPTFAGSVASSTSSIDFDNGNFATLSLSADTFLANPSNLKSGTTYTLIITSGSQVSNYGTSWKFAEGTQPTLSDGTDILTCVSDGTNLYATALANFS